METEDRLVLSALQALVQSADFRAVGVLQGQERSLATDEFGIGHLDLPILFWPGENGLDVKALPNALFVIRRDALSRGGLDVIDAQGLLDGDLTRHVVVAPMTQLDLSLMRCATVGADVDILGRQFRSVALPPEVRQGGFHDPVGAALMIDQTARAEFRNSQKTGSGKEITRFAFAWDEGVKRQARKIVAGQEALSCQIPIRIEIRAIRGLSLFQEL